MAHLGRSPLGASPSPPSAAPAPAAPAPSPSLPPPSSSLRSNVQLQSGSGCARIRCHAGATTHMKQRQPPPPTPHTHAPLLVRVLALELCGRVQLVQRGAVIVRQLHQHTEGGAVAHGTHAQLCVHTVDAVGARGRAGSQPTGRLSQRVLHLLGLARQEAVPQLDLDDRRHAATRRAARLTIIRIEPPAISQPVVERVCPLRAR